MRSTLVVTLLVLTLGLSVAVAWGQISPTLTVGTTARYSGMGEAGLALANDAGALDLNPAGLALQSTPYLAPGSGAPAWGGPSPSGPALMTAQPGPGQSGMAGQVMASDELGSNLHYDAFHYAGFSQGQPFGWGAAYRHASYGGNDYSDWVIGGAWRAPSDRLSFGAAYSHVDLSYATTFGAINSDADLAGGSSTSRDIFNGGLIYLEPVGWTSVPVRWGAVLDVGTHFEPIWSAGVAVPVNNRGGLVADWVDVFNQYDSVLNLGAEYWLGDRYNWAVRLGLADIGGNSHGGAVALDGVAATDPSSSTVSSVGGNRWTAGASYLLQAWQFDLSWEQAKSPVDASLKLSASLGF